MHDAMTLPVRLPASTCVQVSPKLLLVDSRQARSLLQAAKNAARASDNVHIRGRSFGARSRTSWTFISLIRKWPLMDMPELRSYNLLACDDFFVRRITYNIPHPKDC